VWVSLSRDKRLQIANLHFAILNLQSGGPPSPAVFGNWCLSLSSTLGDGAIYRESAGPFMRPEKIF
jgi:hypothetical protein